MNTYVFESHGKVYHPRENKPQRKILKSIDGRIYPEQRSRILKLYHEDLMTMSAIAREYGVFVNRINNLISRERRLAKTDADNEARLQRLEKYEKALDMLDEQRDIAYSQIEAATGLQSRAIRKIARRNGLGRKVICRE